MHITRLLAILATSFASASTLSQSVSLPVPSTVEWGACRPINVSSEEMERQWGLYYSHAVGLTKSAAIANGELQDLQQRKMSPSFLECYTGSKFFALMCFSKATTPRLSVQSIKLIHSPTGSDCLSITVVARR